MNLKQHYRRQALRRRRALSPQARAEASIRIQEQLQQQLARFRKEVKSVLIYRAMEDEVATDMILSLRRWAIFAPVADRHGRMQWRHVGSDCRWRRGKFGIEEPLDGRLWEPSQGPAVLVCPLVAFDRAGNRLGQGFGYFDRWLAGHAQAVAVRIGLGFSCQEVPRIPVEAHDVPLDCIITEREVIACRRS